MSTITIDKDEVLAAENLIVQTLRDAGFEGSLEDGTGIYDLLIKGNALLLSIFKAEQDKSQGFISLAHAEKYKAELGDEYDGAIDSILSNWFVTRRGGAATVGKVVLTCSKALEYLRIANDDETIFKIDNFGFKASKDHIFVEEDFTPVINTTSQVQEYQIVVDVETVDDNMVSVNVGDSVIKYLTNSYIIRAEIYSTFVAGEDSESSESFISRSKEAINTRELISNRAIRTVLRDQFSDIEAVLPIGHGDKEQIRNLVQYEGITVEIGNKVDTYIKAPLEYNVDAFVIGADNIVTLSDAQKISADIVDVRDRSLAFGKLDLVFSEVLSIVAFAGTETFTIGGYVFEFAASAATTFYESDFVEMRDIMGNQVAGFYITLEVQSATALPIDFVLPIPLQDLDETTFIHAKLVDMYCAEDFIYSPISYVIHADTTELEWCAAIKDTSIDAPHTYECLKLDLSTSGLTTGAIVEVHHLVDTSLEEVNSYIDNVDNRVGCFDHRVKSFFPMIIAVDLIIKVNSENYLLTEVAVKQVIVDYTKGLGVGEALVISDLIKYIHNEVPEVTYIAMPVDITYELRNPANKNIITGSISNQSTVPDNLELSVMVNDRTVQLLTFTELINVTVIWD